MAQSVSAAFLQAQQSAVNIIAKQVLLILGNYCTSAYGSTASSSGDFSADFPASGAVDGDRTEINIGPASGADNGVGRSSWKSSAVPNLSQATNLTVNFAVPRTINRIKLYHLFGHGLKSFVLSAFNGTIFVPFASTTDQGMGFTFDTSNQLDVIDFPDVTTSQIKIDIFQTVVANDNANIVEIEAYRKVDITSRVNTVTVDRKRDYKLQNNMAANLSLLLDNTDRYFSPDYTPTTAEVANGFVNAELRPNLLIQANFGFQVASQSIFGGYGLGPYGQTPYGSGASSSLLGVSLVSNFVGLVDSLRVKVASREAEIACRDGIKSIVDLQVNTTLKTGQDITKNIQYLLNLANVSNYEMVLDTTTIILDHFFVDGESVLTAIQDLVVASGDAQFFFDENGIATFQMYLNNVPHSHTDTSEADFEAGTLLNIDTTSVPGSIRRQWLLVDNFADNDFTSNPTWFLRQGSLTNVSVASNALTVTNGGVAGTTEIGTLLNSNFLGTWQADIKISGTDTHDVLQWQFISNANDLSGYLLQFVPSGGGNIAVTLLDHIQNGQNGSLNGSVGTVLNNSTHTYRVTRGAGTFNVYIDTVLKLTIADVDGFAGQRQDVIATSTIGIVSAGSITITNIWWSGAADGVSVATNANAVFTSAAIDQTTSISSEGTLSATDVIPSGYGIILQTSTSGDNITYDPYVVVTNGGAIGSTPRRFIKYQIIFTTPDPSTNSNNAAVAYVADATATWFQGTGTPKFHATPDFVMTDADVLLDIEEEISDSLSGDTSIINTVAVTSSPLVLTGNNTDTQWQGTNGVPAAAISGSNPLTVTPGTYSFQPVINGGMDTSLMSGANPAAAVVVFGGGAVGSWAFSYINPTVPILVVTITVGGTITDLRVVGKSFSSTNTPFNASSSDKNSIKLFGPRAVSVSNAYIISNAIASIIANRLISNFKNPLDYIPKLSAQPTFNVQLGDRISVSDSNTGINVDFNVIGVRQNVGVSMQNIATDTELVLLRIS